METRKGCLLAWHFTSQSVELMLVSCSSGLWGEKNIILEQKTITKKCLAIKIYLKEIFCIFLLREEMGWNQQRAAAVGYVSNSMLKVLVKSLDISVFNIPLCSSASRNCVCLFLLKCCHIYEQKASTRWAASWVCGLQPWKRAKSFPPMLNSFSTTSGNPVSPQSGNGLYPLRFQRWATQSQYLSTTDPHPPHPPPPQALGVESRDTTTLPQICFLQQRVTLFLQTYIILSQKTPSESQ